MDASAVPVDILLPPLPTALTEEEYRLHLAALEWSLADPIVLDTPEDIQSKIQWRDGFSPFRHQVRNLFTFCRHLPVTLLADDVGLGKTISAALILAELMKRRRVRRTLVICPKILCGQWVEELESKVGILGRTASGQELDKLLKSDTPVVVTTYDSGRMRLGGIQPGQFDMIILDEAHKLRNLHGTQQAPKIAQTMYKTLEQRLFRYVLMLTATPIQNRVWDLYSLVDLMAVAKGHKNPLGSPQQFANRFVADRQTGRRLIPGTQDEFRRILRRYVVRTRRKDAQLAFPDRQVKMFPVPATLVEQQLLGILRDGLRACSGLVQISLAVALMSSPQAFVSQLETMAERSPAFKSLAMTASALVRSATGPFGKEAGLLELLDQLRENRPADWRCVIFTTRRETQRSIGKLLDTRGIRYGYVAGNQAGKNAEAIRSFMSDPPGLSVIVSTDAGAEGVNLQKCNVLVNYDLPWNPMVVEQRIGRIQRLSSAHRFVTVINLCLADSPEQRIVGRLIEKLQTISQTVGDIEAILESAMNDSGDLQKAFEHQILDLVTKSLEGQDVSEATRLAERSLTDAKQLLQDQEHEINEKLGDLDELHESGPRPPRLERRDPSLPFRDFVRGVKCVAGGEIAEVEDGLFEFTRSGRVSERFTFDEESHRRHVHPGHFQGSVPKLYEPGRPDFERLVQQWVDRSASHILTNRLIAEEEASSLARDWCRSQLDVKVIDAAFTSTGSDLSGTAVVKAAASNTVDSYEKLIDVPVQSRASGIAEWEDRESLSPSGLVDGLNQLVRQAAENDPDIRSFIEFYQQRLADERKQAAGSESLLKKITDDFSPALNCEVVGLKASSGLSGTVSVRFTSNDGTSGQTTFEVETLRRRLSRTPIIGVCAESGDRSPADHLRKCEVTGLQVLPGLLAASEESGKLGLRRLLETCDVTARKAFSDELETCSLSGKRTVRSHMAASDVSGRRVREDLLVACEFTSAQVLPEELRRSDVSGRSYRCDEREASVVSGKQGHRSEFLRCEETQVWVLPEETERSDVSGKRVRSERIVRSEKSPNRKGLLSELGICSSTGRRLLVDELQKSDASQAQVDKDLLVASDSGAGRALASELVECELTGKRLLPSETDRSAVSGRRIDRRLLKKSAVSASLAAPEEMVRCEFTEDWILKDDALRSEVSERLFRSDQSQRSHVSRVLGHASEFQECQYTGRRALAAELGLSDLTGKSALLTMLQPSEKSGRLGVSEQDELVTCEISRRKLLRDETAISSVSGRRLDRDLLVASPASGRLAAQDELRRCDETFALLLPDEVERCSFTNRVVDQRLIAVSDVTGRRGLKLQLEHIGRGRYAFPDELGPCEETGARLPLSEMEVCAISGKRVNRSLLVTSQVSSRLVLGKHIVTTRPSGKRCASDEVATCPWGGYVTPKPDMFTCQWTGLRLSPEFRGHGERLKPLEQMLFSHEVGEGGAHLADWLEKQLDGALKGLTLVRFVKGPSDNLYAFTCELRQMFGMRTRIAVFAATTRGGKRILGRLTLIKVVNGQAVIDRQIEADPAEAL